MVNSSSFDAANNNTGDRNGAKQARSTQGHEAQCGPQSASPVTAATATSCGTGSSHAAADNSLPCVVAAAIETSTTTTKTNSGDGTMAAHDNSNQNDPESDDKSSLCCSVPLEKLQGVLPTYSKPDNGSTLERGKSKPKLLCLFCDRSFGSANLRQKHVERIHSAKQNRRMSGRRQNISSTPCIHCDKMSNTEHTLNDLFKHMAAEHPTKYFGCLLCEDRFITQVHLSDHNILKHPDLVKNEQSTQIKSETTPSIELVIATPEPEDSIPKKMTRSRLKPKLEDPLGLPEEDEFKKPADVKRKRSSSLKEIKNKIVTIKTSKVVLKRSKRLQAQVKETESERRRTSRRVQKMGDPEVIDSTKLPDKSKPVSINPYPEFDSFYRIKKITDHSIDNLKISSLTFDDVFDKAFFNRIKCNIEDNLLHHIDGKLFKNEESESRISNFEKVGPHTVQSSSSENYGCELTLNAITPVAALSLNSQYGEDFESQIEYGSKPSKKKTTPVKKDEIHYKYFTRRKYQASILEQKENRDLSRLDMWTQLIIKERQQKIINDKKSAKEILEYTSGEEYKSKVKREELDRVLDRRGPFEDLKEEITKKAAFDKLNLTSESVVSAEVFSVVREVVNEILARVLDGCEEEEVTVTVEKPPDDRLIPAFLNLRRTSSLPEEEIDKSDRIALICSSQETENFELPTNKARRKDEALELTGEWARSRIYICAACGFKFPNLKYMLEHKSLYHPNVWVQHYEFVGNQSELYHHLSIPGLGKMGVVEKGPQSKQWRRSDARTCAKCRKQCNSLGELHRHVLECGGDWTWILARKKCKYRPFGAKSRRRRRGLVTRIRRKEKTDSSDTEKKTYKYGPRSKPSDAETIQRMLANLPAKRSRRSFVSLRDVIFKSRKRNQNTNTTPQNQEKSSDNLRSKKPKSQQNQRSANLPSNRRTLRSINKVLSSTILDSSLLRVKRKIKMTNEQRITRQSQKVDKNGKDTPLTENVNKIVKDNTKINTSKNRLKDSEPLIMSNTNIHNKIARKRILNSRLNIKNFFPVKKRNSRRNALYENPSVESEMMGNPISIRPSRNIPSIEKIKESRRGGGLKGLVRNLRKKNNSPSEDKVTTSPVRRPKLTRQQSKESISSDKLTEKTVKAVDSNFEKGDSKTKLVKETSIQNVEDKKQDTRVISAKEKIFNKIKEKKCLKKIQPLEGNPVESKPKTRNLKKKFQNIINNVRKLKLDSTAQCQKPEKTALHAPTQETSVNPHAIFLGKGISEADSSVKTKETPTLLVAKDESVMKESYVPAASNLMDFKENPPVPEKIFNLEPNNEKQLQAKGELNFDKNVDVSLLATDSKICSTIPNTYTINMSTALSINVDTQDKTKNLISPTLISPNLKGKIRKPAKGLNDCIAMLTSKLQRKEGAKLSPSLSMDSVPTAAKEQKKLEEKKIVPPLSPKLDMQHQKSECILRIPTFKVTAPIDDFNETALDLSKKSTSKDNVINKIENTSVYFKPPQELQLSEFGSTLNKVIGDVIEHKCKEVLSEKLTSHGWTSVNDIIKKVIYSESKNLTRKSTGSCFSKNNVDDSIEDVIKRFSLQTDNLSCELNSKSEKKNEKVSGRKKTTSTKDLGPNSSEITLTSLLQENVILSKTIQQAQQFVHLPVISNVEPMNNVLEISTIPCVSNDNDELDIERLIPETKLQRIIRKEDTSLFKTDDILLKCTTSLSTSNLDKLDIFDSEFVQNLKNTREVEQTTDLKLIEKSKTNLKIVSGRNEPQQSNLQMNVPEMPQDSSINSKQDKHSIISNIDIKIFRKDEVISKNKVFSSKRKPTKKRRGRGKRQLSSESGTKLDKTLHTESDDLFPDISFKDLPNVVADSENDFSKLGFSNAILTDKYASADDSEDEIPLVNLAKQEENRDVNDKKCIVDKFDNIAEFTKDTSPKEVTSGAEDKLNAVLYDTKFKTKTRRRNKFVAKTFMKKSKKKRLNIMQTNKSEHDSKKSTETCLSLELCPQKLTEPLDASTPVLANKSHTRRKSKTMKKIGKIDNDLFKDFALVINRKTKRIPPMSIVDDSVCDDSLELLSKTAEVVKSKSSGPDDSVQEMDMELEEIPFNSAIIERDSTADLATSFKEPSLNVSLSTGLDNISEICKIENITTTRKAGRKLRKNKTSITLSDAKNIRQNIVVLPQEESLIDKIDVNNQNMHELSTLVCKETNPIEVLSVSENNEVLQVLAISPKRRGRKPKSASYTSLETSLEETVETKTGCALEKISQPKETESTEPVLPLEENVLPKNNVSPEPRRRGRKSRVKQHSILDMASTVASIENLSALTDAKIDSPQIKRRSKNFKITNKKQNESVQNLKELESSSQDNASSLNIQMNSITCTNPNPLHNKDNPILETVDNKEVAVTSPTRKGRARKSKTVKETLSTPNEINENKLIKETDLNDSIPPENISALGVIKSEEHTSQSKRRSRNSQTELNNILTEDKLIETPLEEQTNIDLPNTTISQNKHKGTKARRNEEERLLLQKSKELLLGSDTHLNSMFNSVPYVELSNNLSLTFKSEKINDKSINTDNIQLENTVSSGVQEETKNVEDLNLVSPKRKCRNKKSPVIKPKTIASIIDNHLNDVLPHNDNSLSTVQENSNDLNLSENILSLPKRKRRKPKTDANTIDNIPNKIEQESIVNTVLDKTELIPLLSQSKSKARGINKQLENSLLPDFASKSNLKPKEPVLPGDNLIVSGSNYLENVTPQIKHKGRKANVEILKKSAVNVEDTHESIIKETNSRTKRRSRKSELELKTVFQESGLVEELAPYHKKNEAFVEYPSYENDLTISETKRGKLDVKGPEILSQEPSDNLLHTNFEVKSVNLSKEVLDCNKKNKTCIEEIISNDAQDKRNKSPEKNCKKDELKLNSFSEYEPVIYKNIFEEIEEKPFRTRSKSKAILAEQSNAMENTKESVYDFVEDIPNLSEKDTFVEEVISELPKEIQVYRNIFEVEEKLSRTRSKAKVILDEIEGSLFQESGQDIERSSGGNNVSKLSIPVVESNIMLHDKTERENIENVNTTCEISESNNIEPAKDKIPETSVNISANDLLSQVKTRGRKKSKNNLDEESTLDMFDKLKESSVNQKLEDSDLFYFEVEGTSTPSSGKLKKDRKMSSAINSKLLEMHDNLPIQSHSLTDKQSVENVSTLVKKPSRGRKKSTQKRSTRNGKTQLSSKTDLNLKSFKDSELITTKSLFITREEISESDLDKQADEEVASLTCRNWNTLVQTDLDESRQSSLSDKGPSPDGARSPSLSPQPEKQEVSKVIDIVPVLNESSDIFDLIKKKPAASEKPLAVEKPIVPELLTEPKVPKLSMRELKKSKGLLVDGADKVPNVIKKPLPDEIMAVSKPSQEIDTFENQDEFRQANILLKSIESLITPEKKVESFKNKLSNKKHNKKNKVAKVRENVMKLFQSNTNLDFDALKSSIEMMAKPVIKNKSKSKDLVAEIEPFTDILTSSDMDIAPVIDEIDKSLEMDDIYDFDDESELPIINKNISSRKEDVAKQKLFNKFKPNRRTSNRTAKAKALEHIHDEALAQLLDEGINPVKLETKKVDKDVPNKSSKKLKGKKATFEANQLLENKKTIDISYNNEDHFESDVNNQQENELLRNIEQITEKKLEKKSNSNLKFQDLHQSKDVPSVTVPESLILDKQVTKPDSINLLDNKTFNNSLKSANETDESIFAPLADSTRVLDIDKENNTLINAHLFQESNSEETLWNKMFAAAKTQTEMLKSPDKTIEHLDVLANIIKENQDNLENSIELPNSEIDQLVALKVSSENVQNKDLNLCVKEKPVKKKPRRKNKKDQELSENSLTKELELIENNPELVESLKENHIADLAEVENQNIFINDDKIDNHELRRSRRGSQKIISYNENDLIDPVIEAYEKKRQSLHVKREKAIDKRTSEAFDSLNDLSVETNNVTVNFETFQCEGAKTDLVDKIYEFTDSPENDENIGESISILRKNKSKQLENSLESSLDSSLPDIKVDKTDKFKTPSSSVYCEICKRTFQRIENLMKHRSTLTHISKLSELEAKEAELKNKQKEVDSQQSEAENRDDISISDILESGKVISNKDQTPFSNNETLQLEDIINEVLNKPAIKSLTIDKPKTDSYNSYNAESDSELETLKLKSKENFSPTLTKTIAEKQISLLENIIEKTGGNLLERIFEPSNHAESDDDLRDVDKFGALSSSYKDNSVPYNKNDILKPENETFAKPDQYEEISEDSTSLSTYDDQKSRKILNRDEELFLECCSLLKSGSEVSNFSKKAQNCTEKLSNIIGQRQFVQPEEEAHELYSDNSRTPTPLGDTFDDNASGSNSIASEWNPQPVDRVGKNFTFKEALSGEPLLTIAPKDEVIAKGIKEKVDEDYLFEDRNDSPLLCSSKESSNEAINNRNDSEEIIPIENKKIITKGARKVFEGLKISIPTEDLDLDIINCHKNDKVDNFIESPGKSKGRKSKPTKKSQVGSSVLFKAKKKKSPTISAENNVVYNFEGTKKQGATNNDIYNFEDTQEPGEVFTKPDFVAFRSEKIDKNTENDNDINVFEDSNGAEVDLMSNASSYSLLSTKKSKPIIENIPKKKSKAMSKIFKNAAKSRMGEIEAEMRDMPEIPEIDNLELVENYVLSCSQMSDRDATVSSDREEKVPTPSLEDELKKTKMTEHEMDKLFDQLIGKKSEEKRKETKLKNKSSSKLKPDVINKKTEIKKTDVKNGEGKKKQLKQRARKRARSDSETDGEFNLNKTKKQSRKKKEEDNVINLEQELRECIGVASRKSQRSCTSGKQNVLVEYWSSDDEAFEKMLQAQNNKKLAKPKPIKKSLTKEELLSREIEKTLGSTSDTAVKDVKEVSVDESVEVVNIKPKAAQKKKPGRKKKPANDEPNVVTQEKNDENSDYPVPNSETVTALNRRKRVASNPLYHWSSSSEDDEPQSMVEITSVREDEEDDRPIQHGWIVGDSPKKLVTMLALTKGKKTDVDCVKEQNKKRTGAVS